MTAYEHARWLVGTAEIAWLTTYEDRGGATGATGRPATFPVGSPVDVVEDPTGCLVLALPSDDDNGHLARLARVPVATLMVCEPAVPGRPEHAVDAVARVIVHGEGRFLDHPHATGQGARARADLARVHRHLDPCEVRPVLLEPSGIRYRPRDGDEVLLAPELFRTLPPGPPSAMSAAMEHIAMCHQQALGWLVREACGPAVAEFVELVRLRPDRLECRVGTASGVSTVVARFDHPVSDAGELVGELVELISRASPCRCANTRQRSTRTNSNE